MLTTRVKPITSVRISGSIPYLVCKPKTKYVFSGFAFEFSAPTAHEILHKEPYCKLLKQLRFIGIKLH